MFFAYAIIYGNDENAHRLYVDSTRANFQTIRSHLTDIKIREYQDITGDITQLSNLNT